MGTDARSAATAPPVYDAVLARRLILDELLDLSLYRALREHTSGRVRETLEELIPVEARHFAFWQSFFDTRLQRLDLPRRLKLAILTAVARLLGPFGVELILEAIEVYGVRKYLTVWDAYKGGPLGEAVRQVLDDEFRHEDEMVTHLAERKISPERIRDIFLGLNDGLIEILGAVSGFFGAFQSSVTVLLAALTTAVAGALSMGAGAYVAVSSEAEVSDVERRRRDFLGEAALAEESTESPLRSALVVGGSYFAGALVPVLPVLFGAKNVVASLVAGGSTVLVVSLVLAFLSGMEVKQRMWINLVIVASAVAVTYLAGVLLNVAFAGPGR